MRSEVLYTVEHGYDGDLSAAVLHDQAFVQGYGRGSGTVDWQGRRGVIEWTNFPPMRPDGVFLPDVRGVIRLDEVARPILFRMHGISLEPDEAGVRLFGGPVRWYTDADELLWLNDRYGFEEGTISVETGRMRSQTHVLHPEAP